MCFFCSNQTTACLAYLYICTVEMYNPLLSYITTSYASGILLANALSKATEVFCFILLFFLMVMEGLNISCAHI